ncbi:MAG TPA: EscU/YscU/HrcU family type III secretion system export apparatus switch protein [Treponema sp.]|nr:EscU/YscU/HrcU family type III secretion system export apparatus switch protein [Treponema sp.]
MEIKRASALKYKDGDYAPRIVASGTGRTADTIIELAEKAGVTIIEDVNLAGILTETMSVGDYVPPWCWDLVARVFAIIKNEEKS